MRRWLPHLSVLGLLGGCSNAPASQLLVERAWARPVASGTAQAVLYFEMTSDIPDTLVGVEVPTAIADDVHLHTSMLGSGHTAGHSHVAPNGATRGENPFGIAPNQRLVLEPGGTHAMLVRVKRDLDIGDAFPATFRLASGRQISTDVVVANNQPE